MTELHKPRPRFNFKGLKEAVEKAASETTYEPLHSYDLELCGIQHIIDNVHLGSVFTARNKELLNLYRIKHIISFYFFAEDAHPGITYYPFKIEDEPEAPLHLYFDAVVEICLAAKKKGENILIHCQQGMSRAPTTVMAYLVKVHGMSAEESKLYTQARRNLIQPNYGFRKQLHEYEVKLRSR